MSKLFRFHTLFLVAASVLLATPAVLRAQVGTIIPIPFVTSVAGVPAGTTATTCQTPLKDIGNLSLNDGCPATQAVLTRIADLQTDPEGNVYIAENGSTGAGQDIRIIYKGGAVLTNILKVANSNIANFTPIPGYIYTLAGGMTGGLAQKSGAYFCGNIANGVQALNSEGDGCPAAQTLLVPRGVAISPAGDIFVTGSSFYNNVRVIYGGGAAAAKLITLENPTVTAPQVGYIYTLTMLSSGYAGDGGLARSGTLAQAQRIALDSKGNVFITDYEPPGTAANYNIRRIDTNTGIITTFAGQHTCTAASATCTVNGTLAYYSTGDGGPASASTLDPYSIFFDSSDNLYIVDYQGASSGNGGRLRVVYAGGTIPGISNPVVGNIYTYAGGGGSSNTNGTLAANVRFGNIDAAGIDSAGNIYVEDISTRVLWKFDAKTSVGYIIAGGPTSTSVAKAGAFCSGTSGPLSTDNFGDGCPGVQAYLNGGGNIAFDASGNFFEADNTNAVVREFSYNNQFGSVADGTPLTQTLAFEATAATVLTSETLTLQGGATTEFANAGSSTCPSAGSLGAKALCLYNLKFTPAHPGLREGTIKFNTAAGVAGIENIFGTGLGSDLAIDTGTKSTLGTGFSPGGVAADLQGNVYVTDTAGGRLLVGQSSGSTLTPLILGLNKPTGVAVDPAGNLYIADTGNNRILEASSTGATIATLGTGLSGPTGVAVDALGNIYVADTGNNRVVHLSASNYQYTVPVVTLATALSAPTQLALDAAGDLFLLDSGNTRIVEINNSNSSSANIFTVAIESGVVPTGIAVDAAGTVYIADSSGLQVLAYPVGAFSSTLLYSGLTGPAALAVDADANLFIADTKASGLTEVRRSVGLFTLPESDVDTKQMTSVEMIVNNVGNAPLTFSAPLATASGASASLYTFASATTDGCGVGAPVAPGVACGLIATYTPSTAGFSPAVVKFTTNAANTGTALANITTDALINLDQTTLSVTYNPSTINFNTPVTFTAKLTPAVSMTATPTGTFTFQVDARLPIITPYSAAAAVTVPNLLVGTHTMTVTYSGDSVYDSMSQTVNFTVSKPVTTTTLTATEVNQSGNISLTFTAAINSPTANGETGTVTFYAGTQALNAIPIDISTATVTTSGNVKTYTVSLSSQPLNFPTNSITAVYSGDANFIGSTSNAFVSTGDFVIATASTAISVSQGYVGYINFTISSLLGSSGTVTATCSGLPANSLCRLLPQSITLGSTVQQIQVQVYTNLPSTLASSEPHSRMKTEILACGLPVGFLLVLIGRRRKMLPYLLALLSAVLILGPTGCGSTNTTPILTPGGTYTMTIVFAGSDGLTTTHTIPLSLTIVPQQGN